MEESAGLKQNVLPREGVLPKGRGRAARKGRAAKEELAALGAGGHLKHGSEVCAGLHETGAVFLATHSHLRSQFLWPAAQGAVLYRNGHSP